MSDRLDLDAVLRNYANPSEVVAAPPVLVLRLAQELAAEREARYRVWNEGHFAGLMHDPRRETANPYTASPPDDEDRA